MVADLYKRNAWSMMVQNEIQNQSISPWTTLCCGILIMFVIKEYLIVKCASPQRPVTFSTVLYLGQLFSSLHLLWDLFHHKMISLVQILKIIKCIGLKLFINVSDAIC